MSEQPSVVGKTPRPVPTRLKQERERRGWSQSELAEHLGTTQVNVSRWETGQTSPGPYLRQQIAQVFGKSLEELGLVSAETGPEVKEQISTGASIAESPVVAPQIPPLWNVPYRQNPFFTGREEILSQVYTVLNTKKSAALTQTQAISGLGGVGKTQIAVEYAYRHRKDYFAVMWVDASSLDRFKDEFAGLAVLFNLPEQNEANQDIVISAVRRWLTTHTAWLLILDNIEDLEILNRYLPTMSGGKVLLTTRQQALGTLAQGISVDKMEEAEGVLFLLRRSKMLVQDDSLSQVGLDALKQAKEIVTVLDGLPLALDQAGAYIEETKCGLSAYFTLYKAHRARLLNRRGKLSAGHPEPVTNTWSLSFQRVASANPAAVELLYLLAFLSPESIYEEMLLKGRAELGSLLCSTIADPLNFNELIELLLHYSLIRRNSEERFLSIHRLVQAVLRENMTQEMTHIWAERTVRAVNSAFPEVEQSTWEQCHRCLPHARLCSLYIKASRLTFPEAASLLNKAATYLIDHAQYNEAEPLLLQALDVLKQDQSNTQLDRVRVLNDLGSLFRIQGKYKEAEPLLQESLLIRQQLLGHDHPATTASLISMAQLYQAQGKYNDAQQRFLEALQVQQRTLEQGHPDIARSQSNLAKLYTDQGRYAEAEALFLQAHASLEQALGQRHRDVASLLNSLALVYRKKAEYEKAEKLYVDVLSIQEQVWGKEHPDVAETLNNIARLFRAQGKYDEAEPIYLRALYIREVVFGSDHPSVAQSHYGLMKLYHSQGLYQEAELAGQRVLAIQEEQLGSEHPDLAFTLSVRARVSRSKHNYEQAERLELQAKEIREKTTSEHPHMAIILNSLGDIYNEQGKLDEARELITRSIEIREKSLGNDHLYMAYGWISLADNHLLRGEYSEAEALYKKALPRRKEKLGDKHARVATIYHKLALLYVAVNRLEEAEVAFRQALDIRAKKLGPQHPSTKDTLEHLFALLRQTGRAREAVVLEESIHALQYQPEGP
jgi:tetratricopeptide (TPR) repeat protein/transcriptional regulator with XRE-family HTH domain